MSALLVPAEIVKFLPCDEVGMLMLLLSLLLSSKSPERVNLFAASESKSVLLAHPIFPLSETLILPLTVNALDASESKSVSLVHPIFPLSGILILPENVANLALSSFKMEVLVFPINSEILNSISPPPFSPLPIPLCKIKLPP